MLGKIILEDQTAFLKGRNIGESIFMINEVIHAMKEHKMDGIILKLDFSKAYDSIDWSCIYQVIECINLGSKWKIWIKKILESTICQFW